MLVLSAYAAPTVVWKQELTLATDQTYALPKGAVVLSTAIQAGRPCIWFLCDPTRERAERHFCVIGTGHQFQMFGRDHRFINTVLMDGYVWHIFERT